MRRLMIGLVVGLGIVGCDGGGGPPAAPSALSAMAKGSSLVVLSWLDRSDNEDGFRIERSDGGEEFAAIGEVAADVTTYVAAGLQPSTAYSFRVRAFRGDGSSASEIALAMTGDLEWKKLPIAGSPSPRDGHSAVYDRLRNRMMVFGGWSLYVAKASISSEIWLLNLSGERTWAPLTVESRGVGRGFHSAILDAAGDRMIVFGGINDLNETTNGLLVLSLAGNPQWSALAPAGTAPTPRHSHSAVYDPVHRRMILFGGLIQGEVATNEVWELGLGEGGEWKQLSPAGEGPTARSEHSAVYDSNAQEMIVFGGRGADGAPSNEVWALTLGVTPAWRKLTPSGAAPALFRHTAVYDAPNRRMLVYGGSDGVKSFFTDTYSLSLTETPAWSLLQPGGTHPKRSVFVSSIAVEETQEWILFGGSPVWKNEEYEPNGELYSLVH